MVMLLISARCDRLILVVEDVNRLFIILKVHSVPFDLKFSYSTILEYACLEYACKKRTDVVLNTYFRAEIAYILVFLK